MSNFKADIPYNDLPLIPPNKLKYETLELWKKESEARASLAELKGIANIIPNQAILVNAIILQEAKDSSEIENIITTRDELYQAISSSKSVDHATKEVMYYREALNWGYKRIEEKGYISEKDIIEIQEILLKNDTGIRKTPGTRLYNEKTKEIVYSPPDEIETIYKLLKNLFEYLNDEESSLIKMGIIHYQFESIHPFHDGNGRTGRILNVLYLLLKEYLEIPILYLSSYIIKNKNDYYRLLRKVTIEDEWEEWLLYILEGVKQTANETIDKIKKIRELLENTIEEVKKNAAKIYTKELIETLFVNPYCKVEFIVNSIGIERKAASRYLHQLSELGILKLEKVGRENIFINMKLMEILKK